MTTTDTARRTRIAHTLAAAGLSLCMTLAALGGVDHLAQSQHAATVLAKAAAAQQAQAAVQHTARVAASRG